MGTFAFIAGAAVGVALMQYLRRGAPGSRRARLLSALDRYSGGGGGPVEPL